MIEILKVKDMCSSSINMDVKYVKNLKLNYMISCKRILIQKDLLTYINIESKKGKELADRFGLDHAYYMVFKEEMDNFKL